MYHSYKWCLPSLPALSFLHKRPLTWLCRESEYHRWYQISPILSVSMTQAKLASPYKWVSPYYYLPKTSWYPRISAFRNIQREHSHRFLPNHLFLSLSCLWLHTSLQSVAQMAEKRNEVLVPLKHFFFCHKRPFSQWTLRGRAIEKTKARSPV